MKSGYFFFFPLFMVVWTCVVPEQSDTAPEGHLLLSGSAISEGGVVFGEGSRTGGTVLLSLTPAAANYYAGRERGYEWKIHHSGEVEELSSLDAGAERFQLFADENPPMSRRVSVGKLLPDGVYYAELMLYANQAKIGDDDYLLTSYKLVFSLRNKEKEN